jgi:hypothetical protein
MVNKKKLRLFFSYFLGVILLAGFIQSTSTAASKSPDLNGDMAVNISDVMLLASVFNTALGDGKYKAEYDLNDDNAINISDVMIIASKFNTKITSTETPAPTPTAPPQQTADKEKILIPHKSWTCGMADGIPKPESGVLVFEANMKLEQIYNMGKTQYGHRQAIIVQSGTITGPKVSGSIMSGGLDFQLDLSNGAMEIEQLLMLKTNDGNYTYLRSAGTAADPDDVRMVFDFEAPNSGSYSWLNSGKYVGRRVIDLSAKTMKISVFDVSGVNVKADSTNSYTVTEPSDVPDQPWDYRKADPSEKKGSQFITETVSLASSQSVGASKRGNRNVIPITGGSVTGKLTAKILAAGADYQNLSNPATIDARYLWQTNDGEIIIVRNAGQFGALVPIFEVRADSKYSYLNNTLYLSSDPGMAGSGVTITFYESKK